MAQAGITHRQRRVQACGHVQHHHQVHTGVDLGVVLSPLGHAPQAVHFGQQAMQGAALAQHLEHARGLRFHQAARQLLPHAFGHQVVGFTVGHHLLHQGQRAGGHAEVVETRGEPGQPQDAHRVFGEGG